MRYLKNMKISHTILVVSLVPIVVAMVLAAQLIFKEVQQSSRLGDLAELTELSVKMSNLVHEQQKERGATASLRSSVGPRLVAHHNDRRIVRILRKFKTFPINGIEDDAVEPTKHSLFERSLGIMNLN